MIKKQTFQLNACLVYVFLFIAKTSNVLIVTDILVTVFSFLKTPYLATLHQSHTTYSYNCS